MIVMVRYAFTALVITLFSTSAFSQVPAFPYPHHTSYPGGTIKPNHKTQTELDTAVASFYDQWKARYVINGCQPDHSYVYYNYEGNGTPGAITVSEAHGYGMIITALMAGYDANAKVVFDGMYRYFKGHPTSHSPYLMSWQQGVGCVNINGNDGATDGDLDIAYALLLADRQWGSTEAINYKQEAINVINAIMEREMNQTDWAPLLGSWVASGSYYNATRSSDFIINHFRQFADVTDDGKWLNIVDSSYSYLETIQSTYSSTTGLLPDFIVNLSTGGEPAGPNFLEGDNDGAYSYNACRDPWRIATDYLLSGDNRAKSALDKINRWIRTKTSNIPSAIRAGYQLDGSNLAGEDYESQAFAAPFMVSAMVNQDNQSWLNSLWDYCTAATLNDSGYYENTIKMLCLIVASGNWWGVQEVPGNAPALNVNRVSVDSMSSPTVGDTVSITFAATGQESPLYYRYWSASGYQTSNYGNWQMLKDWSTDPTLTWIPTTTDHYVIVTHVTDDPTSGSYHQAGLSIATLGNRPSPILIKDLTTTMSYPQSAGTAVNLNTIAAGGSGQLYYKYWHCKGIGGAWNVIRDYSTSSSCTWVPTENGLYTVVVWVSDDTALTEPPIAGMTCTIGGSVPSVPRLQDVRYWGYQIQNLEGAGSVDALVASKYDLLVLDPHRTDWSNGANNFDTKGMVNRLKASRAHDGSRRKLVIAYVNIGQAEDWRWYWMWSKNWQPGDPFPADWPNFIITSDPDGWTGNYPVAYWDENWQDIMIYGQHTGSSPNRDYVSALDEVISDGFDGIYLDWVEGFENEQVIQAAQAAGVDPAQSMIQLIGKIRSYARQRNPNFVVIQQNAAALSEGRPQLYQVIDGIAQEEIWYGGEATDNWDDPQGYDAPVSPTLTSEYLDLLTGYQQAGLPVFCCEYAVNHAAVAYSNAASHNIIAYCTRRSLSQLTVNPPPGY